MKQSTVAILDELEIRYPNLSKLKGNILNAYLIMENAYKKEKNFYFVVMVEVPQIVNT